MAEVADWNLGWEQSKLRWEESSRKMKELAEQLTVSLGQTVEELKQLREEREALDSEIVEEPLVPSQPEFSKEPDEMPNGCLENAVPGPENIVDAPFSDSEQELNAQKVFSELSHLDSNFGVPSNLGVNLATIQRNVEQPIENSKIEDWDRNILGKPPEDSKEWLILEDAKIVGGGLKTASSSQGKGDRSFPCQSEFKKGMYSFPKLDFHVRNAFDFSEKMSFEIEPYEKGELVMLWLDQIRIEISDFSLISVSSLGIIGAQYMFDELPIRSFRSNDPRIQPNNGHWPMGNWIFDSGIPSMISSKWISIVTGNQATTMTKKDCYSWTDFVGFCYPYLVKMTRKMILTFDPGGCFWKVVFGSSKSVDKKVFVQWFTQLSDVFCGSTSDEFNVQSVDSGKLNFDVNRRPELELKELLLQKSGKQISQLGCVRFRKRHVFYSGDTRTVLALHEFFVPVVSEISFCHVVFDPRIACDDRNNTLFELFVDFDVERYWEFDGLNVVFEPGGIDYTYLQEKCGREWGLHELMFFVKSKLKESMETTSLFNHDPGGVFGMWITEFALDFRDYAATVEAGILEQRLQWDPGENWLLPSFMEGMLVQINGSSCAAILIDCCWVLGGLPFGFDPGDMDYSRRSNSIILSMMILPWNECTDLLTNDITRVLQLRLTTVYGIFSSEP